MALVSMSHVCRPHTASRASLGSTLPTRCRVGQPINHSVKHQHNPLIQHPTSIQSDSISTGQGRDVLHCTQTCPTRAHGHELLCSALLTRARTRVMRCRRMDARMARLVWRLARGAGRGARSVRSRRPGKQAGKRPRRIAVGKRPGARGPRRGRCGSGFPRRAVLIRPRLAEGPGRAPLAGWLRTSQMAT